MSGLLFLLFQIVLWIVVGAFYAIVTILPIIIFIGFWEVLSAATWNNLLNAIHKIPFIGPVISGVLGMAIGAILCFIGVFVWINYAFIFLRCIGGGRI